MRRLSLAAILPCLLLFPATSQALWPQNGLPIVTQANNQLAPKTVSDGAGGAIIVWEDNRIATHVYAQRVDAMGNPLWAPDGVIISTPSGISAPQLTSDGSGGAIITWGRNTGDVYAQRINSTGVVQWTAAGVSISSATGVQQVPTITSDTAGGAIITWQDFRSGVEYDIYAQRVNASGVVQWTTDGVAVCTAAFSQQSPQIAADGSGGAVMTWADGRTGSSSDIYVQRVNASGVMQWTANGVALCTAANSQLNPVLLADGLGGAFVAWDDGRTGGVPDIYVQRLNSSGAVLWAPNGVALATTGNGTEPEIVTDGLGGAIVAWQDARSGEMDIYARRINGSGVAQWAANGVALSTAPGLQRPVSAVSDNAGGAIVAFADQRPGSFNDIYAQRIERNGYWGYPAPEIAGVQDVPGDQGGQINLSWNASRLDLFPDELIQTYTVWRALDPAAAAAAIEAGAVRVRDGIDPLPSSGTEIIRVQELNETTFFWKLMNTVTAFHLEGYSDVVPTLFDSTLASPGLHHFQVIAHAAVGQWISQPGSGRSEDNLAPLAPLQLTAQRVGADVHLVWNKNEELDLRDYAVYRKSTAGVTPIPPNFLTNEDDTVLVDASAPTSALYYIVTAIDEHDNQSAPSNEASVSAIPTGVDDTPKSYVLSVSNYPNPFNPRTTVSYSVPARGPVTVAIYDARGALVATLLEEQDRVAGAYTLEWDGRADNGTRAGSGVYFARIEHNGATLSKKMVLLK